MTPTTDLGYGSGPLSRQRRYSAAQPGAGTT